MKTAYRISMVTALARWMIGCAQGGQTGPDTARKAMQHAEEVGLLTFVNDEGTTFEILDVECGIRSDSARQIIKYREGQDRTLGTADDVPFGSVEELEAVHMVGPWTVDMLTKCAAEYGFIPAEDDLELLAFLNDQENTTFRVLDRDCSIRSDSALNIIAHRDGPDGVPGTADDNLFDNVDELESVYMVATWTVGMLRACAQNDVPEPEVTEEYVPDLSRLDPALAAHVQGDLMDLARQYRDTRVYFDVMFAEVVVYSINGLPAWYDVRYRQWIDPEGGIQLWIVITLDVDYAPTDLQTYI